MSAKSPIINKIANVAARALIVVALLLCGHADGSAANKYGIDDSLCQLYEQANASRTSVRCLELADRLIDEAQAINDYTAVCLAHKIKVEYYSQNGTYTQLKAAARQFMDVAQRHGNQQYYYLALRMLTTRMIAEGERKQALDLITQIRRETEADNQPFGVYTLMSLMGDVHLSGGDFARAAIAYREAVDYCQKHLPTEDASQLCTHISEYYRLKQGATPADLIAAMDYANLGIRMANNEHNRAHVLAEKALVLYAQGHTEQFLRTFGQCWPTIERLGMQDSHLQLLLTKNLADGNYEQALRTADRMTVPFEKHMARYRICKAQGRFREALHEYETAVLDLGLFIEASQEKELARMGAQMGNYKLQAENAQLSADAAAAELSKADAQMEIERKNSQLIEANARLEISQIQARSKRQADEIELQKAKMRSQQANNIILLLVLAIILIALGFSIVMRRRGLKMAARLEEKNRELTEAWTKATQADKMKSLFIRHMSHEIRTPLNAIVGFAGLLAHGATKYSDERREKFSQLIDTNSEALTSLINDVLTLSDLESSSQEINSVPTPVNELCRQVVDSVAYRVNHGVKLKLETDLSDSYKIETDRGRLAQVLTNLMVNSCQFTPEGHIELAVFVVDGIESDGVPEAIRFTISDTGSSIPEEERQETFEQFAKLEAFREGSGLGLSVCSALAKALGGVLYVDPFYSDGTRFVLTIPLVLRPDVELPEDLLRMA